MGFCNRLTFQSKLSYLSKKERERVSIVKQKCKHCIRSKNSARCLFQDYFKGRLNNYVSLIFLFWPTYHPPSRFVTFVHENPLALRHSQHTHSPFPIKNKILRFKKDMSRSKVIYFLFHMIFFQLRTNNTKKIHIEAFESETKALSTWQSKMERNKSKL